MEMKSIWIFRRVLEESEKYIVEEWENIVSSLDFCERPEDLVHTLLFLASSLYVRSLDQLVGFSCKYK